MISVQKVIFPGLIAGCLFVLLVTSLIASPKVALAESPAVAQATPTTLPPAAQAASSNLALPMVSAQSPTATPEAQPPPVEQTTQQNPPAAEQAAVEQPAAEEPVPVEQPAAQSEGESCSISSAFPDSVRQWCGLIQSYAGKHGLDENVVAALILQESGGNSRAYSRNGAVGLMQVMPRDGLAAGFVCINGPCFASRPSSDELYDPEFNISYGTRMLAGLIQKYGDTREALRAYGPSNMGYRYADIVLSLVQRYR